MKTTLDLPEDLYRAAKAKAAMDGVRLTDIVTNGLRLVLNQPARIPGYRAAFPLIKGKPEDPPLTSEMVRAALEEEDEEEARRIGLLMRR